MGFRPETSHLEEVARRLLTVSFLFGMDHIGSDLSLSDGTDSPVVELPFEEAVAFLKGRVPVTKKEWSALGPKLQFRAFALAKLESYALIDRVRQQLIKAVEEGVGLASFWDNLEEKEAGSPRYWETVYRTNIQTAYNAGRKVQIDRTKPQALQLIVIDDDRTTKHICRPLIGVVLAYTDPWWKTHWPPFHFGCRTTVRPIYGTTLSHSQKPQGFAAQRGFGRDPVDSGNYWMMTPEMFVRGLVTGAITEFNFIDNVVADFDSVWPGFKRKKTGDGWVEVPEKKPDDFLQTRRVATRLAGEGYKSKILPTHELDGWKNPDLFLDGQLFDLKIPESLTKRGVESRLRSAHEQGVRNVVLEVPEAMDADEVKRGISGYLGFGNNRDHLDRIIVLLGGKVFDLRRADLLAKRFGF